MGAYERPKGSGIWWILYYVNGKRFREKVGSCEHAKKLYTKRKNAALAGEKMPELRRRRILLGELIDDAIEYARQHNSDIRSYVTKGQVLRDEFGDREVNSLLPQELGRWLTKRTKTAATYNRYKSFISLCYREGIANGKATANPARILRQRKENNGRLRFLTRQEAERLEASIAKLFPHHLSEFLVSLHTGVRLSEQYDLKWKTGKHDGFIDFDRKVVDLSKTKNGCPRVIPMNSVALAALESQRKAIEQHEPYVFPRRGAKRDTRSWFHPCLADAKIEGYTWHGNRHTFCSWLAMAGVSLKVIQELAGHKTISMSARYSHLSPDHKQAEIERITSPTKVIKFAGR